MDNLRPLAPLKSCCKFTRATLKSSLTLCTLIIKCLPENQIVFVIHLIHNVKAQCHGFKIVGNIVLVLLLILIKVKKILKGFKNMSIYNGRK